MNFLLKSSIRLALLAAAAPALAQEADPIGALLDQAAAVPPPAPASAAPPPVAAPYVPPPAARPYAPPPAPPQLGAPVHVDEYDRTVGAPLNPIELGYETRLRSSFASAQGLQGPLDGAWTLRAGDGQPLYSLLLVDRGQGQLEGAWRDPRRRGATDSSGFLADIRRAGAQLTASFHPRPGAAAASLTLTPSANGTWTGQLDEDGARTPVTLRRD